MEYLPHCTSAELESVMERYGRMVYRLAYSHTRCRADAEDIYQEVFLRYFQKRPVFDSEDHRRAWLLRVTVNRCRTLFASAWFRHRASPVGWDPTMEQEETGLDEALALLRPGDRLVLHLFYYEELSVQEIAASLHRKDSTIRTQLTRARRRLAAIMKGEGYVEEGI